MTTDKPRAWIFLLACPAGEARLDAHLEMRGGLQNDLDAPVTLATKRPMDDGASTHAVPAGGVAGAERDVFAAGTCVVSPRDNVAFGPPSANGSRCGRRAMTAMVVDNLSTLSGHATHAGRPPASLGSDVLARAGTSPHP